jgi:hypothetical protein
MAILCLLIGLKKTQNFIPTFLMYAAVFFAEKQIS